jgi:hypothetical protein
MEQDSESFYTKHIYWLTGEEEILLREHLRGLNIRMGSARGVVCTPLHQFNNISSVAPEVWSATCARQGSWYRASAKNGLYLVISSFEIRRYESKKWATITRSHFTAQRTAGPEEKKALVADPKFIKGIPAEWQVVSEAEKKVYLRWARRLGSNTEDYDFLYLSHTSNHANFIKPRFFVEAKEEIIPYSIDRSAHLCSCCLELFGVIGERFRKKLVAPCPGATMIAGLKPDRYLLVESQDRGHDT